MVFITEAPSPEAPSPETSPRRNEPIAIVGSGCRFPGGSNSPARLWELLREPRDVLCEIPPSRFDTRGFHHADSQFPGRANVKHSYLLEEDVAQFDAQFFNITASEAIAMDPQQRLLLETVYEGLESAGLTIEGLKGSNTGVYVGVMYVDYESLQFRDLQHVPTYLAIGTARSILSNRISYFFDWHGPSLTVDTACSSSLVAVHQAVQALRSGEVRVALAAGSNLLLGPEPYIHESKLKMLSPDGRSRMWDQGANGYARGDGVAAVVLKTLSAALADGDHIEAIIRETGVNQDGRSRGITMPSAAAQAALIRATYAKAGLDPESPADRCQYFEAHGTGTPAGDPVEAEAVHTAFFGSKDSSGGGGDPDDGGDPGPGPGDGDGDGAESDRLLVGSIKTIIGHTESTAGLAGILKVVQAMKHGHVPPNMLLENLNPNVLPYYKHLKIPQQLTPWPPVLPGQSRRASVNSFGFGGTNAHIILESFAPSEHPNDQHDNNQSQQASPANVHPFLFSAQSKQSLLASISAYSQYLEQHPDTSPADLAWTLQSRRSRLPLRLALPASTIATLQTSLAGILGNSNFQLESKAAGNSTKKARLLGIFTGQGAQWARMGAELVETSAYASDLLDAMDGALARLPEEDRPSWTLREQLLADAASSQVGNASVSQPLCTVVQVILVELLRHCGIRFAAVVGHSSGEIGAAFAAGLLSAQDAIRIAYYRGLHSRLAGGGLDGIQKGAMLAVGTTLEDAESLCNDEYFLGRVKVAACNSASSITISGDEAAIVDMVDIFEDENKFVRRLRVDKAYHSHHMAPCSQPYLDSMRPFAAAAATDGPTTTTTTTQPTCTWVSSVHPDQPPLDETTTSVDASYWVDNLLSPVLFMQAVEKAVQLLGPFDAAVEVGPHPALKGPVLDTLRDQQKQQGQGDMPYTGLLQRNTPAIQSVSSAIGYIWTHVDNLRIDFDQYEAAMLGGSDSDSGPAPGPAPGSGSAPDSGSGSGSDLGPAKPHRFLPDLPTYQWNHSQGYWHESTLSRNLRTRSQPAHPLLGDWQPQSSAQQVTWKAILRPHDLPWLHHHRIQGQTVFPAAAYAVTALETIPFLVAADDSSSSSPVRLMEISNLAIHQALVFGNDEQDSGIEVRSVVSSINREEAGSVTARFTYEACIGSQHDFQLVASCDISVLLGEPSADTLPATARAEPYMVDVDTELAYSSLKDVGYGYTGPFKALSGLRRKLGKASGVVALSSSPGGSGAHADDVLVVHPAVLDAAFHSIILTFSYPEDGRLWSLHLPTRIDRIRINPALCGRHWADASEAPFVASMSDEADESQDTLARDTSGFQGDVDIHGVDGQHTAVQVEGLHVVPFIPASAADDQQQFYAMDWVPSEPNADVPGEYEASAQDKEMAVILERGSHFYLGQLERQIPADHPGRSDLHNAAYLAFASHTTELVRQGKHRYAKKEWVKDTLDDIRALSAPFSDQPEIKAMHVVGEHMPRAIRGETTMLEHLMDNGLLADYYAQARSITRGTGLLADAVLQILRRYPASNILEVGAGTGQATREILGRLDVDVDVNDHHVSSYTFTDVSAAFLDKAEAEFAAFEDRMVYRVLDLEQDMAPQGFEEHSYDVVVASFVLHATRSLEQTARRVRSLLKPGGYLVLYEVTNTHIIRGTALFGCLPGWWQGFDEGRTLGACVSESAWDAVLRKTGFSGIDSMTPVKDALALPNSVIVSQAVDDWVDFMREPLLASSPSLLLTAGQSVIRHLFIVGGASLRVSRLTQQVAKLIHAFCDDVTVLESLEDLLRLQHDADMDMGMDLDMDRVMDKTATVLVLEDLDHAVFKDMTPARWEALKTLFGSEKSIVWVSQDRMVDNPYGNMGVGFARSALWETPEIRFQSIDMQDARRGIDARVLVEAVLRFAMAPSASAAGPRKRLWSVESEIVIDSDGRQLVPRMRPVRDANDRYNSARRTIVKRVETRHARFAIDKLDGDDGGFVLVETSPSDSAGDVTESSSSSSSSISLTLTHSTLEAIVKTDVGGDACYLVLGRCTTTGQQYLGLGHSLASSVNVPESSLVPCSVAPESASLFLTEVAAHLLVPALTGPLGDGDTLLVHNAPASVVRLLSRQSTKANVRLVCTTTSSKEAADGSDVTYLGRYMRQSELRALLPASISRCVDFTTTPRQDASSSSWIASCLPANVPVVKASSLVLFTGTNTPETTATHDGDSIKKLIATAVDEARLATIEQGPPPHLATFVNQVSIQDLEKHKKVAENALTVVDWDVPAVSVAVQPATAQFRPDRTYWLVGLSGDLGISIADWMMRNGAKYLVITSRNPNVDEAWLKKTEARGMVVRIMACDLTDYDALAETHRDISRTLPPISGVYQGAMILLDMALRDMRLDDFSRVLRPKVEGSLNLDRVLGDEPLDFFVFFSSVATVAGNPGQAGYTTANLFMSGMAQQRRHRGLPASVVELGLIMGTGYITREKGNVLTRPSFERGLLTISEYDVHQTLAEAIRYGRPHSGPGPGFGKGSGFGPGSDSGSGSGAEWQISIGLRRMPASAPDRPRWYDYPQFACLSERAAAEDTTAANTQSGPSIKDQLAAATTREEVQTIIAESFISEMRKMLHLSDDYAITPAIRTDELGLDSLVAVRIRSWFLNNFQVNIPALRILKGEALQGLIDFAAQEIPDELAPNLSSSSSPSCSSSSPPQSTDSTSSSSASDVSSQQPGTPPSTTSERDSESSPPSIVDGQEVDDTDRKEEPGPPEVQLERFGRLSYTQSVFLFVHELLPDKTTLNNTVMLHLSGQIRVADLSAAVRALGERHESLRSCICHRDGQPSQGVIKAPSLALEHRRIHNKDELANEYAALRNHVFDLSRGQTSRTILLSYSPRDHYLLMSSHHIFFDRASNDAVMGDLERLYHGYPLEPSPLQYLDYSDDQQRQHASGQWDGAVEFWRQEFTTIPDPLSLRRSRLAERRPLDRYESRIPDFCIDKPLSEKIRRVARSCHATPFHFHLAAFKVLLLRFLGTTDVCIGIADGCRRDDHMATGIGPFLNMLPLRMPASADQLFVDALAEAREKSFAVLANSIPLELILNTLRVSRQATHTPLAQAFMNYAENDLADGQTFLGCRMTMMKQEMAELPYDITFTVINNNTTGDTRVLLNLQKSLYTESDAQILQDGYLDILNEFANTPHQPVGSKWHFRPALLQQALDLGRGPKFESTWPETLVHRFQDFFPTVADNVAVTDDAGGSLTYAELSSQTAVIASELLRQGVQAGSRVAVFQHPSACWVPSLLAILQVGAVYVPLDANTPLARLSLIVRDCQPASILIHAPTVDDTEKLETQPGTAIIDVSTLATSHGGEQEPAPNLARPDAPAIILYTSGSSGTPKGVILSHGSLKHEFDHCAATYGLEAHDVVLQQSAWSFDLSVTQLFLALGVGARLHVLHHTMRADSHALAELLRSQGVTATYATPTEYKSWLRRGHQEALRSSSQWRLALVAGEPVTEPLLALFRDLGCDHLRLFNVYGPTETTCGSTKMELSYKNPDTYQGGTIPVGAASANERFYILDSSQNLQPVGQTGEVAIAGVGVAMGYLNLDDQTRASFLPDPFATEDDARRGWTTMYRTGDVGFLQPGGSLVLQGRIGDDTEVKLNGVRIDLKDVEKTVLQVSRGLLVDAVASLRSTSGGEVSFIVVHVVFAAEQVTNDKGKLLQALLAELPLPRTMRPSALIPVDMLPRTVAGKVDRRSISAMPIPRGLFHRTQQEVDEALASSSSAAATALSSSETMLRGFWEAVVPEELVGLHRQIDASSDFFAIGGSSLLLIELQGRIRADLGVSIPLPKLFQATTLRSMAQLLPGVQDTGSAGDGCIDWPTETALLPDLTTAATQRVITDPVTVTDRPRTVVLTGATGFLGQHLARRLVDDEHIERVICIAVRNATDQARQHLLSQLGPKAEFHEGDLSLPLLGLGSEDAALAIFQTADVVIHNGADVSHLKTYASLRAANLGATKELVRWCIPRRIPLHYVSTTGVAMYTPFEALAEVSVREHAPPVDGLHGYVASKWASEVYLENAHAQSGLPVYIHRPSSIVRPEADRTGENPAADVLQNMLDYSRRIRAVPRAPGLNGFVDLVQPETVTEKVMDAVMSGSREEEGVVYVHDSGDLELDVRHIRDYLSTEIGHDVEALTLDDWIDRAEEIGLSPAMSAVFRSALGSEEPMNLPRLLRR